MMISREGVLTFSIFDFRFGCCVLRSGGGDGWDQQVQDRLAYSESYSLSATGQIDAGTNQLTTDESAHKAPPHWPSLLFPVVSGRL